MHYREFPAPDELSRLVRCVWTFEGEFGQPHDERIVPDGSPELIFHFGVPYSEANSEGKWRPEPRALLAGNLTEPLLLRGKGRVGVLGLRLWPHAVGSFVDVDTRGTLNARIALSPGAARFASGCVKQLCADNSEATICATACRLVEGLAIPAALYDAEIAWGVQELFAGQGQVHMIRSFRRFAGCLPREYMAKAGVLSALLLLPR